ncbi:hypothetical protein [Mucisphaera calidilacus]|uniref:Uncharacterized protein n=1 Tax=Mucisphaera calidilacus TaxID=2527982 RepID=A0A518BWI4_9BACT|nr:hypothetical protein [Mucisphaera calidilacus]QDU71335.1 hypothetical protein Pan265_11840 [Mucisphaera calidilacus]
MTAAAKPEFNWEQQPAAQAVVDRLIKEAVALSPSAEKMGKGMSEQAGTRLLDWLDHIAAPSNAVSESELKEVGFELVGQTPHGKPVYEHLGAIFPRVIVNTEALGLALKADSVSDYLATHGIAAEIHGQPLARLRSARVDRDEKAQLWVIERHGWTSFEPPAYDAEQALRSLDHLDSFRTRNRWHDNDVAGFEHAYQLIERVADDLGEDWACDLFFEAERQYWMRRNRAARVQKARQDKLGLGWANHDHHTFRSGREAYKYLIKALELMGFFCRERFYAGAQAGWGAQVLEHKTTRITIFADVDMSPEEVEGDFAHNGLPAAEKLGTVGLWTALHGESFLQAGLHHLECQFDFDGLREQMKAEAGIGMMDPFSNFDHLKQQFTEGERWAVDAGRISRLVEAGMITEDQGGQFSTQGAIGSHLENLERNNGFKGFNQTGISHIIAKTDPREHLAKA